MGGMETAFAPADDGLWGAPKIHFALAILMGDLRQPGEVVWSTLLVLVRRLARR